MTRPVARIPAVLVLAVVLCLVGAPPGAADETDEAAGTPEAPPLGVGTPAPALDVAHWIKGVAMDRRGAFTPITAFEPGKVYVVEFWATWCGPCRAGMPHLSELQAAHAADGVTVIGISDESLPKVVEFLWEKAPDGQLQNDRTRYTLATDPDRSVFDAYMTAAGQTGIPTAFLVGKDGHVEWIGHPIRIDEPLRRVIAGTWDREAARMEFEAVWRVAQAIRTARPRLAAATKAEDWPAVLAIYDGLLEVAPGDAELALQRIVVLLQHGEDGDAAYAALEDLAKRSWDDANVLNRLAWTIADDREVRHRRLSVALDLAERAYLLTDAKDAAVLDTLARVHFEIALGIQREAVERAPEGPLRDQLREVLDRYEGAAPK